MLNENMNIRLILISNVSKRRANTNLICQHKRGHVTSYINLFGLVHLDLFKETTLYITFQLAKQNGKLSTWLTHLAFAINLTIEREKKKKKKGGKKNFWFARYESVTNYCIDIHKHIRRMKCIRIETFLPCPPLKTRREILQEMFQNIWSNRWSLKISLSSGYRVSDTFRTKWVGRIVVRFPAVLCDRYLRIGRRGWRKRGCNSSRESETVFLRETNWSVALRG